MSCATFIPVAVAEARQQAARSARVRATEMSRSERNRIPDGPRVANLGQEELNIGCFELKTVWRLIAWPGWSGSFHNEWGYVFPYISFAFADNNAAFKSLRLI
jgi:hypothetical protein